MKGEVAPFPAFATFTLTFSCRDPDARTSWAFWQNYVEHQLPAAARRAGTHLPSAAVRLPNSVYQSTLSLLTPSAMKTSRKSSAAISLPRQTLRQLAGFELFSP
jgi:hypothetical protein